MVLTWLLLWGFGGTDGGREAVRGARVLFPFAIVGRTWCSLLGPKCSCFHGMLCRFFGDFPEDFALTIPRCGQGPLVGCLPPQTALSESLHVWVLPHPGGQTLHWAFRTPTASSPTAPCPPRGAQHLWALFSPQSPVHSLHP